MKEENVDWDALEALSGSIPGVRVEIISGEMWRKRFCWDVAPCDKAEIVREAMGLNPASPEVEDMEHRQSHERLAAAAPMMPMLQMFAQFATEAAVNAILVEGDIEVPEYQKREMMEKTLPVVYQSSWAILAELIDMGALHFPHFMEPPGE